MTPNSPPPEKILRLKRYRGFGLDFHPTVFLVSIAIILGFVLLTLFNLEQMSGLYALVKTWISDTFGWLFILLVQLFLLFVVVLMLSRFGHVRLGGVDARPDYSFASWFAMLFSAGMGIGLVFWGVAEPLTHYASPPVGEGGNVASAKLAMDITFLHWGFHAWAIYATVGLALAYFSFNHGLPLTIRSAFYPLLGDRVNGFWGNVIDIMAVVATLFGVATSLGLGVSQINSGLSYAFGLPDTDMMKLLLILVITLIATGSVVAGLDKGVKRLSEINLWLALALLLFVMILGPTLFIFRSIIENTGHYFQNLFLISSFTQSYRPDTNWLGNWTIFYWAWWIAWSPFVGMFIARVSRGRTIREFCLGVLLVPTTLTFVWMTVFGGTAIYLDLFVGEPLVEAVNNNVSTALFKFLEEFPLARATSVLGVLLVMIFFVTSSDSGSLVIDTITAGGHHGSPVAQRVFWATTEGAVAAALMVGGGLQAIQTASISTGLPFALVLAVMCFSLYRALAQDYPREPLLSRRAKAAASARTSGVQQRRDES